MTDYDSRILSKAAVKIEKAMAQKAQNVISRMAVDMAEYARQVGEWHGLREALDLLKLAEKEER